MTINSEVTIFLTLAFIVPGFIWHCVQSAFIPKKTETTQLLFLRFLTFSCFNYAFWSWLIYVFLATEYTSQHPIRTSCFWGVIIFVSPVAMGILTGWLSQRQFARKVLSKMGLASIHSIPTAWDYKFYNTNSCVWIQIELKDGKKIAGLYGSESFSSSSQSERDLYIQQAIRIKDGKWEKLDRSDGVLIKGDQIKYIEFIKDQGVQNGQRKPEQ